MTFAEAPCIDVTVQNTTGVSWLSLITLLIAVSALMVSFLQYRANAKEHRRNAPRLQFQAMYGSRVHVSGDKEIRAVVVNAQNAGRAAIEVSSMLIGSAVGTKKTMLVGQNNSVDTLSSPLPFRLESNSSAYWCFDANSLEGDEVHVWITLGDGTENVLIAKVDDYDFSRSRSIDEMFRTKVEAKKSWWRSA